MLVISKPGFYALIASIVACRNVAEAAPIPGPSEMNNFQGHVRTRSIDSLDSLADIAAFQLQRRDPIEPEFVDEKGDDLIYHLANFQLQSRSRERRRR